MSWMQHQWDKQLELARHMQEQTAKMIMEQQRPLLETMRAFLEKSPGHGTENPYVVPGVGLNASHAFTLGQLSPQDNIDDFIDAFERIGGH